MINKKLIPQQYYNLQQAAEALDCEVMHILQWGGEGRLECCVLLSCENVEPHFLRGGKVEWFFPDSKDAENNHLYEKQQRYECLQEFFEVNNRPFGVVSEYSMLRGYYEEFAVYGDGLWLLSPLCIRDMVAGEWPELPSTTLWPAGKNKPDGDLRLTYITVISECDKVKVFDASQVYITWDDVKRIEECIENQKLPDVLPHFRMFHPYMEFASTEPAVDLEAEVKIYPGKHGQFINAVTRVLKEEPGICRSIAAVVREIKDNHPRWGLAAVAVATTNKNLEEVVIDAIKKGYLPDFNKQ
ncbi:UNVERIFIED_ORG: hypothetical protein J2Y78_004140 [Buttiauxella agrestis ATCC 33320]